MKKTTKISLIALGAASLLVLAGCSTKQPAATSIGTAATAKKPVTNTSDVPAKTAQNPPVTIAPSTTTQASTNVNSDLQQAQNEVNSLNTNDLNAVTSSTTGTTSAN